MVLTRSNRRPAGKNLHNHKTKQPKLEEAEGQTLVGQQSSTPQDFDLTASVSSFTLENYESQLDVWSEKQLLDVLSKQTNHSNCIPPEVQEALRFHKMNATKLKLMLALIGNVLAKMVNSWLRASADIPVPPKGCPHGWDNCNGDVGKAWRALSEKEKEVFKAKVFRHFSKLPIPDDPDEEDDNNNETDTFQATISHEELIYQPLYEKLVNHDKVNLLLVQKDDGPNPKSKTEKQVINHINRVNSEFFTISNLYNLTYYVLVATQFPGSGSFCKELSNNSVWLGVAQDC
ncbi:hypothetical protein PCASD_26780 [Puccinia coronata f. sp. avenae]|uniref:Uncharacterized protein n=1 Tax=Puccinia coronata f. sp. avenae TaxID=200324 RepID=A0A2N5RVH9_9BASI|nr:hypothetical protein PCASD_26780 [Puccinia coronata f. sp. avenae]